jgi:hypothetical protein
LWRGPNIGVLLVRTHPGAPRLLPGPRPEWWRNERERRGRGVGRRFDPGLLPEARSPELDAHGSRLEGPTAPSASKGPESLLLGYNGVRGGSKASLGGTKRGSGMILRCGQGRVEGPRSRTRSSARPGSRRLSQDAACWPASYRLPYAPGRIFILPHNTLRLRERSSARFRPLAAWWDRGYAGSCMRISENTPSTHSGEGVGPRGWWSRGRYARLCFVSRYVGRGRSL